MLRRILYLGYYLKKLDAEQFWRFFSYVKKQKNVSSFSLMVDIIVSSLKYNISLLEYFQFCFYKLSDEERKQYAGTGCMYEYQLVMNPKSSRCVLEDKIEFHKRFGQFVKHLAVDRKSLRRDETLRALLLSNPSGKVVLKNSRGQCGWQVRILDAAFFQDHDIVSFMENNGFDLAEEFINQHPDLMKLSPSGVNTIRIITQLNADNEVELLGARLRISENCPVDNMASGNFAAPIDIDTGTVNGPGVYSDITKEDVDIHPVTGVPVVGFRIPLWPEIIAMAKKAALIEPANRSVGWDIAVTEKGPELIEGNHDWCKLVWQLPVKQGLKAILDRHLDEYKNR